jgi:hypothetical protein
MDLIFGYRDRGLATPFNPEVLMRAGISESLVPRVMKSMEGLDLIDSAGNPTPGMEGLRRATTDEFKARLEEVVRAAYAEVFQFTDPAKDDATRIADAFRSYQPAGQRARMVTLFMGMCAAAGIVSENGTRKAAPTARPMKKTEPLRRAGNVASVSRTHGASGAVIDNGALDPVLAMVLQKLPKPGEGWTQAERDHWLRFFTTNLDFVIPLGAKATTANETADNA